MIISTKEFSQFSRVVSECMRSVIALHWDTFDAIQWCRQGAVETLLSKLLGYKNSSELYHALKNGSTIEYAYLRDISNKQLDKVEPFIDQLTRDTVLSSIHSAVAIFVPPPLEVSLSTEFQAFYPDIVNSDSSYDEECQQIYLSLTDNKIYPFSSDYAPEKLNRIVLLAPTNIYVHVLLSRLNSPYAQQQLAAMREHQPLVGFYQECKSYMDYGWQGPVFDSIKCLSPRTNGFKYNL